MQILTDSDDFVHPLITSTVEKIRFSLGYVDAKQLAKRLDRIALADKHSSHRSGHYDVGGEALAKSLFVAWVRARYNHLERCDVAALVKREILPSVSPDRGRSACCREYPDISACPNSYPSP